MSNANGGIITINNDSEKDVFKGESVTISIAFSDDITDPEKLDWVPINEAIKVWDIES